VPSVARAQGSWSSPFNHETIASGPTVPNPNATDHLIPFGGYTNPNISYYTHAPGLVFDWMQRLNAVHMCLIPKGPHRGKVVVWGTAMPLNGAPVLLKAPGFGPRGVYMLFLVTSSGAVADALWVHLQ
jgi:hypothetical protein